MTAANKGGWSKVPTSIEAKDHVGGDIICVGAPPTLTRGGGLLIMSSHNKEAQCSRAVYVKA
jgi:hypothetical protein